ncbi:dUTPase-like protein [Lasiosphaeria miniovina]|uniref:dUTPase-like protein n=1 Tax=Lasiosphaeria miniovina TaxID=1954250 RepID=A0AA40DXN3_9PEZI|nr:dUTPase-like protein [Lasiosphaeria miniovina]KAK0716826.1 dUTPase-like protein [Lasiosphaeria miniovina]
MLSGAAIIKNGIVRNLRSASEQLQPCGIDLSLRRVLAWTSPATIDFDNSTRRAACTSTLPFSEPSTNSTAADVVQLAQGAYLVEFNETVDIPLDCMGQIFVRSSLWRSGATITAGVVDAGYQGALGALLDVRNPAGIVLCRNAKLGQITLHRMEEKVAGYSGIYQFSADSVGRDGQSTQSVSDVDSVSDIDSTGKSQP